MINIAEREENNQYKPYSVRANEKRPNIFYPIYIMIKKRYDYHQF